MLRAPLDLDQLLPWLAPDRVVHARVRVVFLSLEEYVLALHLCWSGIEEKSMGHKGRQISWRFRLVCVFGWRGITALCRQHEVRISARLRDT